MTLIMDDGLRVFSTSHIVIKYTYMIFCRSDLRIATLTSTSESENIRRGEVNSPVLLSESLKTRNTLKTLKQEVLAPEVRNVYSKR